MDPTPPPQSPDPEDILRSYSRALDEIHLLRTALAYEAEVTQTHLSLATFPKSRRPIAERQITRMNDAAKGSVSAAYANVSDAARRHVRRTLGIETPTRHSFENETTPSPEGN